MFCSALTVSAQDHEDSVVVYFEQGRTAFYPEYRENARRCDEFIKRISAIQKISNFEITEVQYKPMSSPEGDRGFNEFLISERARFMTNYLHGKLEFPDSVVTVSPFVSEWRSVRQRVIDDPDMPFKDEVIRLIDKDTTDTARETLLMQLDSGKVWLYMDQKFMADLRSFAIFVHVGFRMPQLEEVVIEEPESVDLPYIEMADTSVRWTPVNLEYVGLRKYKGNHILKVKTNAVGWAMMVANASVEYQVIPHVSVALPFYYSGGLNYFKQNIKFRGMVIQPQVRYYPWIRYDVNSGFYVGAHLGLGLYNVAYGGEWRIQDHNGRRPSYGGGIDVGYSMQFRKNSRWGLDFTIGAGVYDSKYDVFHNVENGAYYQTSVRKTWVGVDNASVAVTYLFDFKKRRK